MEIITFLIKAELKNGQTCEGRVDCSIEPWCIFSWKRWLHAYWSFSSTLKENGIIGVSLPLKGEWYYWSFASTLTANLLQPFIYERNSLVLFPLYKKNTNEKKVDRKCAVRIRQQIFTF